VSDEWKARCRWAVDRRQLLILVVASVMLASFALFVLWPKHRRLSALDEAVEQERRLLSQRVTASHEGVYVSARIPGLRKAGARIERCLPAEPRVAEFLHMMDRCLAENPSVTHEVARSTVPWSGPTPAIPLCLRLKGPFEAVYRSLAGIEQIERLSRFRRVRVLKGETGGEVMAEAELLVYYLPKENPADGRVPATPAGEPEPGQKTGNEPS